MTEKSNNLKANFNWCVFKVASVNKLEIKNSIKKMYGVTVKKCNIINVKSKKKRSRSGKIGYVSGFKKALVLLKEGEKFNFYEEE